MSLSEEVIQSLKDKAINYDYIRFTWSDFHGIARGKTIPSHVAGTAFKNGIGCISAHTAFGPRSEFSYVNRIVDSKFCNIYAKPITDKITALPWAGGGKYKVGEIFCEPFWPDGTIQEANPRYVARRQLNELKSMGLQLLSACEQEFTICKDGKPIFDETDFLSHLRFSEVEDIMFDIEQNMRKCDIITESLECEYSPGQVEMVFKPLFGIETADSMFRFRTGVKEILKKRNLLGVFMSQPFLSEKALVTATHFNHSLWYKDTFKNAMYDDDKEGNFSDLGKLWVGGIIKHMDALTALCCPTINCYRGLHSLFYGDKKDWDFDNRLASLRIKSLNEENTYVENRMPSAASNVYLVMAATVAAGIDGIKNKIEPPLRGKQEQSLPHTLEESLNALENNEVLKKAMGQEFVDWFLAEKRTVELAKFSKHDIKNKKEEEYKAERDEYLEMI